MKKVACVGILVADVIAEPVGSYPAPGMLQHVNSITVHNGGNAMTAAINLHKMGVDSKMVGKVGASIVSCRRGGASAAFDRLNKYFSISNMPIASSQYWNQVHGNTPDEVVQDLEGMQTMRDLARNMAWMMKCFEAGRNAGIPLPEQVEVRIFTNYIR
jgi:hypothetical protein